MENDISPVRTANAKSRAGEQSGQSYPAVPPPHLWGSDVSRDFLCELGWALTHKPGLPALRGCLALDPEAFFDESERVLFVGIRALAQEGAFTWSLLRQWLLEQGAEYRGPLYLLVPIFAHDWGGGTGALPALRAKLEELLGRRRAWLNAYAEIQREERRR